MSIAISTSPGQIMALTVDERPVLFSSHLTGEWVAGMTRPIPGFHVENAALHTDGPRGQSCTIDGRLLDDFQRSEKKHDIPRAQHALIRSHCGARSGRKDRAFGYGENFLNRIK